MRPIRPLIVVVMILMAAAPFAFVVAAVLSPLWSWIEAATGLESMGHSGPAAWCYCATWVALSALGLWLWRRGARGRPTRVPPETGEARQPGR
ncbi:MAG: hypothetical protein ACTHOH_07525 [Lysobacteraceae bacterium]